MADENEEFDGYHEPDEEGPDEEEERPRDAQIDVAKVSLMRDLFAVKPDDVFYQRQVEVLFEKPFFHWITAKALHELAAEGQIMTEERQHPGFRMNLFWSPKNRYWKRRATQIENLVLRFSDSEFTRGLGHHGETMFDAALPQAGFMPVAKNVRSYDGRTWTKSRHNLDRVFVKDGLPYGIEIKNTLGYMDREELEIKLDMCRHLGLTPLFIVRMFPASYMELVHRRFGITLIVEWQLYPHGQEAFAKEIEAELGLKVGCPKAIHEGTIKRLARLHDSLLERMKRAQQEDENP